MKAAELGKKWNNTRQNGMRIKVRSRGELINEKNYPSFDGNHWPGPNDIFAREEASDHMVFAGHSLKS